MAKINIGANENKSYNHLQYMMRLSQLPATTTIKRETHPAVQGKPVIILDLALPNPKHAPQFSSSAGDRSIKHARQQTFKPGLFIITKANTNDIHYYSIALAPISLYDAAPHGKT